MFLIPEKNPPKLQKSDLLENIFWRDCWQEIPTLIVLAPSCWTQILNHFFYRSRFHRNLVIKLDDWKFVWIDICISIALQNKVIDVKNFVPPCLYVPCLWVQVLQEFCTTLSLCTLSLGTGFTHTGFKNIFTLMHPRYIERWLNSQIPKWTCSYGQFQYSGHLLGKIYPIVIGEARACSDL